MMESLTIRDHEQFLRQVSKPINSSDKNLHKYIQILKEYCNTHNCFAMAAVQLGIPKRLIYINSTDINDKDKDEGIVLINPTILIQKGRTECWEGCMSGLDNFGLVERPYFLRVSYQTINGKTKEADFEGFASTVLSHEIDHLDGIFHMDRSKELIKLEMPYWSEYRKSHPYRILSKDCEFTYAPPKIKTK